ncbi:MAG: HAD family hydrolase [Planctomycetes bacterium]|nr:HAD family hydrolase [Planctomycetota bacterium]
MAKDPQAELKAFQARHDFFVGIDSDGCAFDTMEIKHKECFIPNIINHWRLQPVSKYAREAAEFVNLYSKWRGCNRFIALAMVFDLLTERKEIKKRKVKIPKAPQIRKFIDSGIPLGEPGLKLYMKKNKSAELKQAYKWSRAVNDTIADIVHDIPPFPGVKESMKKLSKHADMICVSATPGEALTREWKEHGIARYAAVIAGQEMGKKSEHIALATKGQYSKSRILMVGDAPGDMKAARANGALFYPINPGHEEDSWQRFYDEAIDKFLNEKYNGAYEKKLIKEFNKLLPSKPPWK